MKESSWQIEYQCPQCGAPVLLEETDRLFSCAYCRVKLYLFSKDCFRYCLPPSVNAPKEIFHVPYWRLKGMEFSCKGIEVAHRIVDANFLASDLSFLPFSLGLRPQALKVKFASPKTEGQFLKARVPLKGVLPMLTEQPLFEETPAVPPFYRAFIGETASLVYCPMFIRGNVLYDAILNKPVETLTQDQREKVLACTHSVNWQTGFIPTLCPHCGWDLEGERDTLVLFCKNCESAWASSSTGLKQISFAVIPDDRSSVVYLPFWKMKAQVEEPELLSYADLARIMNLPKALKSEWHEQDLHFWSPAFKIRPALFLRLAKALTITQPRGKVKRGLPDSSLYPVTLPVNEAAEGLKIVLAHLTSVKKILFPKLLKMKIHVKGFLLVYLPFTLSGSEFVQSGIPLSINKNALDFGRML